ncbi:MAG: putative DNA binding domain-containing protein, partial [Deltaproteobacteria bacterium]|nr:putative DNA binding domain-containing protein [Deltaproteobacteria bacterium]
KLICSMNNSLGGYCLLGVSQQKNRVGIEIKCSDDVKAIIDKIQNNLKYIVGQCDLMMSVYPLQNKRIILSLYVKRGIKYIGVKEDSSVYYFKDRQIIILPISEVQQTIEERYSETIKKDLNKRIGIIEQNCKLINNYFRAFEIINKFDGSSLLFYNNINQKIVDSYKFDKKTKPHILQMIASKENGHCIGNVVYLKDMMGPRVENGYLRITPPILKVKNIPKKKVTKEAIYIAPKCAVFYDKCENLFYSNVIDAILVVSSNNKIYSNKFLTAFLKSSFFIWYLFMKSEDTDIFNSEVFKMIRIPVLTESSKDIVKNIERDVDLIVKKEKEYLRSSNKTIKKELYNKKTTTHNRSVEILYNNIDNEIYRLLNLTENDCALIKEYLTEKKCFMPIDSK